METMVAKPGAEQRDGFLFLANQLALDFLNTHPVVNGEAAELLPDLAAVLRWFQSAGLLTAKTAMRLRQEWNDSARAHRSFVRLRAFRERLRQAVSAWEDGKPLAPSLIAELNCLMAAHPMLIRLRSGERGAEMDLHFDPRNPEDLLAPIVQSAATLFAGADPGRVRKCSNCVLQ